MNVKLKGCHQDVVQWLWTALTPQKHVQARLWKVIAQLNLPRWKQRLGVGVGVRVGVGVGRLERSSFTED